MTNAVLKEQADKAQKDYVEPQEQEEIFTPITYYFKSYDDDQKTTNWGTGTVQTTGIESNDFTQVKVLTNTPFEEFVGQQFYITSNAKTDGTLYKLYTDAGETEANIYVEISETEFTE